MFMQEKIKDIDERLEVLAQYAHIMVWGAGIHTSRLFERTHLLSYRVQGVVDIDARKQGEYYFGFTVQSPEEIFWNDVDVVVISVPNREQEIKSVLTKRLNFTGYILALYEQDEHTPFYNLYDKQKTGLKCENDYGNWFNALKDRLDVSKWMPEGFHSITERSRVETDEKKITVGLLYCEETSYNMIHSLYYAFDSDCLFEPVVILQGKGYGNRYQQLENQMRSRNMMYEFDYNCTGKKIDILIVHHIQLLPTGDIMEIIDNALMKAAVPVGVISYDGRGLNANNLRNYQVTEVFCENSIYERTPQNVRKEFQCHVTGNPKFDYIYQAYLHDIEIPDKFKKLMSPSIDKIILWTTDHNGLVQMCSPDVAFDLYADIVFDYINKHKETGLIFRPYNSYVGALLADGLWTREQLDQFKDYCDKSENIVWDDEPDYSVSYSLADAILADAGCGIICSALPMMKPIGVTLRWDMEVEEILSRNQEILDSHYLISSEREMISFIKMIMDEEDTEIEKRRKLCEKYVTHFDGKNGERIKDILKEKWIIQRERCIG